MLEDWNNLCDQGYIMEVVEGCELRALVLRKTDGGLYGDDLTWVVDDAGMVVGFRETTQDPSCGGWKTRRAGIQLECGYEEPSYCNWYRVRQLFNRDRIDDCTDYGTICTLCGNETCEAGPRGTGGAPG